MKKIVAIIIASVLGVAAIVTGIILIVHFAGSKSYKINFYEDPSKQILLQSQSCDEGAAVTYDYEKNVFKHDITCCYVIRVDFMW